MTRLSWYRGREVLLPQYTKICAGIEPLVSSLNPLIIGEIMQLCNTFPSVFYFQASVVAQPSSREHTLKTHTVFIHCPPSSSFRRVHRCDGEVEDFDLPIRQQPPLGRSKSNSQPYSPYSTVWGTRIRRILTANLTWPSRVGLLSL